jgi:hypothetical protein
MVYGRCCVLANRSDVMHSLWQMGACCVVVGRICCSRAETGPAEEADRQIHCVNDYAHIIVWRIVRIIFRGACSQRLFKRT